ncbi:hypothetical protein O6H91_12G052400 [Diphasiastrum complanatum]|uniref:Uncharacterized protein n=2 Tax=Diphasiastrum complanatum TaxID=34168 RepID=A0ACC2C1T4_DIPCM|nr:hypothetical protein O6H91_12G052400 [Diphasiastrum complanatum]KAJ7535984.1 hypothetical protein O6H91_12G052400 [Diphasiastrum complanatum]
MEIQSKVNERISLEHSREASNDFLDEIPDKSEPIRCKTRDGFLLIKNFEDPLIVKNFKKRKANKSKVEPVRKKVKGNEDQNFELDGEEDNSLQVTAETIARRYQLDVLEKAVSGNIIVYLETGCGKTLIAVLLIRSLAHRLRISGNKRVAIFLAPTVHLVHQQSEVISINTDLKVGTYYGDKGVDTWTPQIWATEVDEHEVLVMTPQVLLDALGTSSLRLDLVEVLIMDECHHAQKRHPYAQIMSMHYHNSSPNKRPKVFGMTASPVNRKGVTSSMDCNDQIQKLEAILDAKVCTVEDRSEVEQFVPTPNQQSRYYKKCTGMWDSVRGSLENLKDKFVNAEARDDTALDTEFLCDEIEGNVRKLIGRLHNALDFCLAELGLWAAFQASEIYLRDDKGVLTDDFIGGAKKSQSLKTQFLRECLEILQMAIPQGSTNCCNSDNEIKVAVKTGLISPKVLLLVEELLRYREVQDVRCIIFVERVITSMVLAKLPSLFSDLSFFRCDHMTGVNAEQGVKNSRQQQQTIELFRSGKVNLLVATSVAEEGLDVQGCNSVIRFDLPKTVCSYIQSRGRARRPGSDYIFFLERDNKLHETLIFEVIKSEASMKQQSCSRSDMSLEEKQTKLSFVEIFKVESTGALFSVDTSVNLIYRYCSKLPGDKFYRPAPDFSFTEIVEEKLCVCTIKFPPNAPLHVVVGEGRSNRQLSKQAACFEACKQLYFCGALTEYLVPLKDLEEDEEDNMNMGKRNRSGAGTTKRKELHPSVDTEAFFGEWRSGCGIRLQAYKISFSFQPDQDEDYADFALLLNCALDQDVTDIEVQLHLTMGRMSTAKISAFGTIDLDANQLRDSMKYHEVLYNGMFSRLIFRSKGGNESLAKCLFTSEEQKLWTPSRMYLLLPLLPSADCRAKSVEQAIDWNGISSTAAAAKLIFQRYSPSKENLLVSLEALDGPPSQKAEDKNILQTAVGVVPISSVKDTVVLTVHTGKVYCIVDVLHDMNATHAFSETQGSEAPQFSSYCDYFLTKYKTALRFPYQPLLQVKQTHRLHNLLTEKEKEREVEAKVVGAQSLVELPPELCLDLGLKSSVVRSLYLIPSVMHRWIAYINASQLRHQIIDSFPNCLFVSAKQIMQALTTLRCRESFSFEGFELLGDSFLKYAVSRRLFLVYNDKHEGQLSARRSRAICNATLHRLALKRELPRFIQDEVFDPSRWVAPGMYCKKDVVCRCNTSNLLGSGEEENEDEKVITDQVVRIGKTCANGHRWLCSKTIADAVEALIGAYFVEGGDSTAMAFMRWVGIDIDFESSLMDAARTHPALSPDMVQIVQSSLEALEKQLEYSFRNKALLLEAVTHASQQQLHGGICYQRLEFLGDSVLDLLITRHLFNSHPGLSPGCLTDLRSAAVNNDCFARVAVKHNLQKFLRHGSAALLGKITEFVKCLGNTNDNQMKVSFGWDGVEGPKVLGDIVESIAGAILVDTGFDLEVVWTVMKPLLSPIVTPETLPLHPVRELQELCDLNEFCLQWQKVQRKEKATIMQLSIDLGENKLVEKSIVVQKQVARKELAKKMLATLQGLGLTHSRKTAVLQCVNNQGLQSLIPVSNNINPLFDKVPLEHDKSGIEDFPLKHLIATTDFKQTGTLDFEDDKNSTQTVNQSKRCKLDETSLSVSLGGKSSVLVDLKVKLDCTMPISIEPSETLSVKEDQMLESTRCVQGGSLAMSSTDAIEDVEGDAVMLTSTSGSTGSVFLKDGENATFDSDQAAAGSCFGDFKCLPPTLLSLNTEAASTVKSDCSFKKQEANDLCGPGDFRYLPAFLLELKKLLNEDTPSECHSSFTQKQLNYEKNKPGGSASILTSADFQIQSPSIATLSTQIKAGNGRSRLYELCSKRKWKAPQFSLSREEGLPHEKRFTFSVRVEVQEIGAQEVEGSKMPDKKKAMDSAAVNMILHLTSMGISP